MFVTVIVILLRLLLMLMLMFTIYEINSLITYLNPDTTDQAIPNSKTCLTRDLLSNCRSQQIQVFQWKGGECDSFSCAYRPVRQTGFLLYNIAVYLYSFSSFERDSLQLDNNISC